MTKLHVIAPIELGLRGIDWLTMRETKWEETTYAELPVLQKRYILRRRDNLIISVSLTCLHGDAPFILQDLTICAARAIRSYQGCKCTNTTPCKAHAKGVDVRSFRGVPDFMANDPEGLRAWLEGRNAGIVG
jgi:hypothetical protein